MAGEETAHTPWASLFSVAFDPYSGYVEDEKRAEELIKAHEIATTTRFTIFKKTGGFSNNGKHFVQVSSFLISMSLQFKNHVCRPSSFFNPGQKGKTQKPKNHKIQWADSQETAGCSLRFDGIPFQIVGVKILECQNGPDRNKALKRKEAKKKMQEDVSTSTMQGRVLDQVA